MNTNRRNFITKLSLLAGALGVAHKANPKKPKAISQKQFQDALSAAQRNHRIALHRQAKWSFTGVASDHIEAGQLVGMLSDGRLMPWRAGTVIGIALSTTAKGALVTIAPPLDA